MKRLVILGGGESGVGTAILGKQKGWEVFLSDKGSLKPHYRETLNKEGIQWEEGTHTELLARNGLYASMWDNFQKGIEWKV